jgi:AraC-like DNA-binding protein
MMNHWDLATHHRLWRTPQVFGGVWYFTATSTRFPIHTQDELEFNLIVRGSARLRVEGQDQDLLPGMLVWLPAGPAHGLVSVSSDFVAWVASFRGDLVEDLRSHDAGLAVDGEVRTMWLGSRDFDAISRECFDLLLHPRESASFNDGLARLLLLAWGAPEGVPLERRVHPFVTRAARLLSAPDGPSTTPALARRVGMHRNDLVPLFREQLGVSLVHFRNHERVQRFVRIYSASLQRNALCASLDAGFQSYPQFFREFRLVTGWTPSQHARLLNAGELPREHWFDPMTPAQE